MHNELTNLLPPERRRALVRTYFIRIGVISIVLINILVLAAALLLFPTYVFLTKSMSAKQAHLASIEASLSSSNGKGLAARLAALTTNATILTALANTPAVSVIIRKVLAVEHPGVTLSGFSYSPATDKTSSGGLTISGTAVTRDALRNYQLALQSAPITLSAALPVSAYAKDSNIAFTIVITLAPQGAGITP